MVTSVRRVNGLAKDMGSSSVRRRRARGVTGDAPEKGKRGATRRHRSGSLLSRAAAEIRRGMDFERSGCVPADTAVGLRVPADTARFAGRALLVGLDAEPAHDLEQAGVVGQAQLLGGAGDVPVVPLQRRDHDLALGFGLEAWKSRPRAAAAGRCSPPGSPTGTCSGPIRSPSAAMIIRSMTLRSSRTLLRLQSYAHERSSASPRELLGPDAEPLADGGQNASANSGTSESRSRSGGTRITWTLSRK